MKTSYVHLPSKMWYCKVMLDCCFEIISYNPADPGIGRKIDKDSDDLDSGTLACACHPSLQIIPIEEEEYNMRYAEALAMQQQRA